MPTYDPATAKKEFCVLLMAPPGGTKTTFLLQWPKVGVLNFDDNLAGPVRFLKSKNLLKPFKYFNCFEDAKCAKLPYVDQVNRMQVGINEFIADPEIDLIGIDSMTSLELALNAHVLAGQGKLKPGTREVLEDATMEIQYWKPWQAILINMLLKLRQSGKLVFLLSHCDYKYKSAMDKSGPGDLISIRPTMPGGMKDWIGFIFTDVWFLQLKDTGGGQFSTQVTTLPDSTKDLKNSLLLERTFIATAEKIRDIIARTKSI